MGLFWVVDVVVVVGWVVVVVGWVVVVVVVGFAVVVVVVLGFVVVVVVVVVVVGLFVVVVGWEGFVGFIKKIVDTATAKTTIIAKIIIVVFVSKLLNKFSDNFYVKSAIYGLKPASCALLASVAINLMRSNIINMPAAIVFIIFLLISLRIKKDPLFYLASTGLIGFLLKSMGLI